MIQTQERKNLERHLSFVIGQAVDLRRADSLWFDPASLKRAYYRRAKELHPDRAVGQGLDPEVMTERFRSLQDSYEAVLAFLDSGRLTALLRELSKGGAGGNPTGPEDGNRSTFGSPKTSRPGKASGAGSQARHCSSYGPTAGADAKTGAGPKSRARNGASAGGRTSTASYHDVRDRTHRAEKETYYRGIIPPFRLRLAEWLYYTGRVSFEALISALVWQYTARPKVGGIALGLGYLNSQTINAVLGGRLAGEPFCRAAVRLGYLTEFERSVILGRQRLMNLPIGSYFEDHGIVSRYDVETALRELWAHNMRVPSRAAV